MEGLRQQESKPVSRTFKKGEVVSLKKISLHEGQQSDIESGAIMYGRLIGDIRIGDSARLADGSQTSTIQKIYEEDGKTYLETRTSVYEMVPNEISDLNIENELGEIHLPEDAKLAEFEAQEPLDQIFKSPNQTFEFHINYEALKGVLLEINEGQLFKGGNEMQGRLFVVCKVGNIHLPFYKSSEGTSGKKKGQWYPFFGVTQMWIVKGETNEDGEMKYNEEITKVQNLLNENLRIPNSNYISPNGLFGSGKGEGFEPTSVYLDLKDHIKYQNGFFFENETNQDHTVRVTGYDPKKVMNDGKGSAHKWIDDVVGAIK